MTNKVLRAASLLALPAALFFGISGANAHADLEHSTPAANASIGSPEKIELHFSEAVEPRLSGIKLVKGGTEVATHAMPASDTKALVAMPSAPLAPGVYTVSWTAMTPADGHKMTGTFTFTVK